MDIALVLLVIVLVAAVATIVRIAAGGWRRPRPPTPPLVVDAPDPPAPAPATNRTASCAASPRSGRSSARTRRPIYFVSATAFNLLGIDRWVRNFTFVNWYDSFDGTHPNIFVPGERGYHEFESIEEIVNHLLGHKEVADLVEHRGGAGKACFLMFDTETEENLEASA